MKQLSLFLFAMIALSGLSKAQTSGTIPNRDFEYWDSTSYSELDSPWVTSNATCIAATGNPNVTKVPGFSGEAVHLQTYAINNDTFIAQISNFGGLSLGVPYTQSPTAIKGYYRCSMVGHDTGYLAIGFVSGGNIYYQKYIPFYGSVSTFTAFSDTMNLPFAPDSMVVAAVSSNEVNYVGISAGSWLELDQLSFTGTAITQQIADGDFDSWTTQSIYLPSEWQAAPLVNPYSGNGVSKSTDHYSGKYSVKIVAPQNSYGPFAQLTSGIYDQYGNLSGGQPYQQMTDTLTGYYKFIPTGLDSAGVLINLQNQGNIISQLGATLAPASAWTAFQIPISVMSAPDTMRIDLYSSIYNAVTGGSTLYIDALQLKSQPHTAGISFNSKPSFNISAFPDPAQNQLNIRFGANVPGEFGLKIFNSEGKLMIDNQFNSGNSLVTIPIDQLSAGLYFYEINTNGSSVRNKFVKSN